MSTTKTFIIETGKCIPVKENKKGIILLFVAELIVSSKQNKFEFRPCNVDAGVYPFIELIAPRQRPVFGEKELLKIKLDSIDPKDLISAVKENAWYLDLIFCYDYEEDRENGYLFLGLWRDGVV